MSAHILVVEDDPLTRNAMADLLRDEGYEVDTARDGADALAAVERCVPDLVISDVRMPRLDGIHLVERLRAGQSSQAVEILLVSAYADADRRRAGLDVGADDFVSKPVDAKELLSRVRAHLRRASERSALERRAVIDPLTGVLNRRGIMDVLARDEERARRSHRPLSVLMIDVDHFKSINDRYGHRAGDTVLRHVARALADTVRAADRVGRCGGDEFMIVLADEGAAAADVLATRVKTLRLSGIPIGAGPDHCVTVSIGAATLEADDTIETLVERADREMYRAKQTVELRVVRTTEPG